MRVTLTVIIAGLLVGCQTMRSADSTRAEISNASQAWADAFNKCDPERISALYDREAVLWGTFAPEIISTPAGVRQYFERACSSPTPPKVAFTEQLIRVHGDAANNSGSYTFTAMRDGKPTPIPARYAMSYRRTGDQWLIVDHHSSPRPAPPKP